jgi:hypothetical protein
MTKGAAKQNKQTPERHSHVILNGAKRNEESPEPGQCLKRGRSFTSFRMTIKAVPSSLRYSTSSRMTKIERTLFLRQLLYYLITNYYNYEYL